MHQKPALVVGPGDQGLLDRLLALAPDAMLVVAPDGAIVNLNDQALTLFGYEADELLGRPIEYLVPARFAKTHPAHRTGYVADPRTRPMGAELDLYAVRRDGTEFPAEISLSSMEAEGLSSAIVAVRDVTERRQAEQARDRLAAIVDSSDDAIIGQAADGTVSSWNAGAEALYGVTAAEALGHPLAELVGEELDEDRSVDPDGSVLHREARHRRSDDSVVDIALTVSPIRNARGETIGQATIARDISDRKRAEQMFQQLLELAPDAIVGIDVSGSIVLVNRQAEVLFGYERDELLGQPIELLVPKRLAGGHARHRDGYFADPRTRPMGAGLELFGVRRDGSEFPAEISLSSIETEDGPVATAAVRDISERARTDRERALIHELNQTRRLESVGQLAGGIAHDFNNLLGIILNYAKFVADDLPEGSQAREDLDEVRQAAERAGALTRQLLIFSRREVVQPEVLDLREVISGLENLLRRALGERIELVTTHADDLWPVEADPGQIEQVLVNLAVNARDAMPDGGRLVVQTEDVVLDDAFAQTHVDLKPGRYVRMTVSDTGVGMDAEVIQRAFEPFFTTKMKGEGTGLGLATVYGIVTQAGGRVDLYSEPSIGTTVKIHLPASDSPVGSTEKHGEVVALGRGETILVVEDEPGVRRVAERVLTGAGYHVVVAAGGPEALTAITDQPVDLLLTDVIMPGMLGTELVAQLRASKPTLRVIYMSGYSHSILSHDTLVAEADSAFLEKPFSAASLLQRVRGLLDAGG